MCFHIHFQQKYFGSDFDGDYHMENELKWTPETHKRRLSFSIEHFTINAYFNLQTIIKTSYFVLFFVMKI